jgi:hypothetical protein
VPYVAVFVILGVVFVIAYMTTPIDFIQWRSQHSLNGEWGKILTRVVKNDLAAIEF